VDPKILASEWTTHLADDDAQGARVMFCRTTTDAFLDAGKVLHLGGYVLRDEAARGVSLATRMAGALAGGACDLLDARNAYAAAALARQFVEVGYLLWTFADNAQDAARWLSASRSQLSKRFTPRAMRERSDGRFQSGEYQTHCDYGGHPNPVAWVLLPHAAPAIDYVRAGWVDLGQHLERAWPLLISACAGIEYSEATTESVGPVEQARREWHERDPLAQRMPLPKPP
jgi:hypothetical protein